MKAPKDKLQEGLWRGSPPGPGRAELRDHPELEIEARLTSALNKLPDVPVPSNFTARVLNAIEREAPTSERPRAWRWGWRLVLPRVAFAAVLLVFAGILIERKNDREDLAQTAMILASARPAPNPDILSDFDDIDRMGHLAVADEELLALQ